MKPEKINKVIKLLPEEKIKKIVKGYLLTYWHLLAMGIFLILIAFFLMFYLISKGPIGSLGFLLFLLIGIFLIIKTLWIWSHKVLIITNKRIVDIDQKGLFERTVSEIPFDKLEDVSYKRKGIFSTILRYGILRLQAKKEHGLIIEFSRIKKPQELQAYIDGCLSEAGYDEDDEPVTSEEKEVLVEEFLDQPDDYQEYNLEELVNDYKKEFGENYLKQLLVKNLEQEKEKKLSVDN